MARPGRRGQARGALAGVLTFVLVLGLGVAGVAAWLHGRDALPIAERCAALLDGTSWYLDPEQAANAALLGGIAEQRGLPARALTIAIATTLQESKLRNIDYGDRDSLGLFQQRPSQGWGTPEQVQDPVHATNAFYDALVRVDGYLELPITEAAQAVQRSAFPDAYGQHEARARAWASALSGWSPGSLTCTLPEAGTADPEAFAGLVARDLGVQPTIEGTTAVLDASALPDGEAEAGRLGWAVAQWAVGTAGQTQAVEVRTADQVWTRSTAGWTASTDPLPTGRVEVSFAAP